MTLWGSALYSEPSDEHLRKLNDSIGFDRRLYAQDIAGSIAYARAIQAAGVITAGEADQIVSGLEQVKAEFESGAFVIGEGDEDIHTAVERRLTELIGAVGGKLHTGRSRNDQVATDFRLWTRDAIEDVRIQLGFLQAALIETAEKHIDSVMPGYTHMQPAQPITAAHWLMSFFWMLARDVERLNDALRRVNVSPLGAGALAGNPFGVDRAGLAQALGFREAAQNSLDAVADRDYAAETLFVFTMIGVHLSRLAEDVILYSNPSFGFIRLDDRYSTGSSMMPQKRNPDPMELARGKAGRLIGNLTGLLATLKGTPSTYNKDYQEDKEALFDSFDSLDLLLPVMTAIVKTLLLNPEKLKAALDPELLATDLADYLVKKGLPFRQAHHAAGAAVRKAAEQGIPLGDLALEDLRELSPLFEVDIRDVFDFEASVARRDAIGGTAPDAVREQIRAARAVMGSKS
ncbi:MAG: argininosuccinate lyase [Anaerolineae bacterium]|nr:argininosuccinate lyase [Anaerolineae bacterium]